MDEMKNLSDSEAPQASAGASNGSSDESASLSGSDGSQPVVECSSGSFWLLHPTKFGRYIVLRRSGKGGFGEVFLAHDDELDRPVAIKVPNPERISQPEDIEAYLTEARILASLDHPHIVPVYDVGRTEDGLCFVVSKLIEGSDLATRMGSPPSAPRIRRNWLRRSPTPCITPTPEGWSTGTSSPPTS